MKYINTYRTLGPLMLDGVTTERVAAACRDAALAFMAGVAEGWTKRDLATWLEGPYTAATSWTPHGERTLAKLETRPGSLDPAVIEHLLVSTRADIVAMLAESLGPTPFEFAHDAVVREIVRRGIAADLEPVWLPIDKPRMLLHDRVCALFAAHRLNDPTTHAALFICPKCDSVTFDERARDAGWCSLHRHRSGIELNGALLLAALAAGDDK